MPDLLSNSWTKHHNSFQQRLRQEPEAVLAERAWTCPHCGRLVEARVEEFPKPTNPDAVSRVLVVPERCGCEAETARLAGLAKEKDAYRRRAEWEASLMRAGLVGWLGEATFDGYGYRDDWSQAGERRQQVQGYAAALLNGGLAQPWLILHGGYGTGKSHLAAALVRTLLEHGWRHVYFRVWPEYLDRVKASWDRSKRGEPGETEEQISAELQHGRLVVVDDLDKQPPTEWAKKMLYTALNYRYNLRLPTVLTFNYGPTDADPKAAGRLALAEYLGEAVLDRLIESAFDVVEFDGPSYRSGVQWHAAGEAARVRKGVTT
jgi:DNA replication protein DnaC